MRFLWILAFGVLAGFPVQADEGTASKLTTVLTKLAARAQEIRPMLSDEPLRYCPPISDRVFWDSLASLPEYANVISRAEKYLKTPIPEVSDELYLEFSQNGNRDRYQRARAARHEPRSLFVLAECLENKGRFVPRIEEQIRALAADRSWCLPAHDKKLENFHGHYTIDLIAAASGFALALLDSVLAEKLSPEIRQLVDEQLEARIFKPYEASVAAGGTWWLVGKNNWNSVCICGVTGAAMVHLASAERRAYYVAVAEHFSQNAVEGYGLDGYCSEGVSYWNYGFGHYIRLAEILRRATGDQIRLLDRDRLREVALYGFRIQIYPTVVPYFADCPFSTQPCGNCLDFLNRYYGLHIPGVAPAKRRFDLASLATESPELLTFSAAPSAPSASSTPSVSPWQEERTWFSEANVLITRPGSTESLVSENLVPEKLVPEKLYAAMKGGHNAELHNHNDVGAYMLVFRGTFPAIDVGGEVYTRNTFSKMRYTSDVLNSWGHNVPVVAGQLQKTGRAAEAKILRADFSPEQDVLELDLRQVYGVEACTRLTRTFTYRRTESPTFCVTDSVEFASPQMLETALVTITSWKREGNQILFGEGETEIVADIEVWIHGERSDAWTLKESAFQANFRLRDKARRLGVVLNEPVKKAEIRVTFHAR